MLSSKHKDLKVQVKAILSHCEEYELTQDHYKVVLDVCGKVLVARVAAEWLLKEETMMFYPVLDTASSS